MTYYQLEHAIRAACTVADDDEIWVFGSQAILASYPNPPSALTASIEVDVEPINKPKAVHSIDGALGEGSPFFATHGFYVHGVNIHGLVVLPDGWKDRTIPVQHKVGTHGNIGRCLEAHDLAASKLAAFRPKDRDFVRTLLVEEMIN